MRLAVKLMQNKKQKTPTPEVGKKNKKPDLLKECQKQKDEYLAGWQRAKADFLNYKKEEAEKNQRARQSAEQNCLLSFLVVYENLEKAAAQSQDQGIQQIEQQFQQILESYGLKETKALGERFDPNLHEAVEQIESNKEEGTILEVLRKGYTMNNQLLIPSQVKISK